MINRQCHNSLIINTTWWWNRKMRITRIVSKIWGSSDSIEASRRKKINRSSDSSGSNVRVVGCRISVCVCVKERQGQWERQGSRDWETKIGVRDAKREWERWAPPSGVLWATRSSLYVSLAVGQERLLGLMVAVATQYQRWRWRLVRFSRTRVFLFLLLSSSPIHSWFCPRLFRPFPKCRS